MNSSATECTPRLRQFDDMHPTAVPINLYRSTFMKKLFAVATALLASASLSAPAAESGPTDAQIAAIVVTANQVDIDAGKLAASKSNRKEVKEFAQLMVTDHTGVNKSATELVTKLKVKPEE